MYKPILKPQYMIVNINNQVQMNIKHILNNQKNKEDQNNSTLQITMIFKMNQLIKVDMGEGKVIIQDQEMIGIKVEDKSIKIMKEFQMINKIIKMIQMMDGTREIRQHTGEEEEGRVEVIVKKEEVDRETSEEVIEEEDQDD